MSNLHYGNISFCHALRQLLLLVVFFCFHTVSAQSGSSLEYRWQVLLNKYNSGDLSVKLYADSIDVLVQNDFGDPHLKERLSTYRQLVWENESEKWRRQQYFWFLTINARQNNNSGKAFYYMEKRFKELGLTGFNLGLAFYKLEHFQQSGVRDSVVSEYRKMLPTIIAIPRRILTDSTGEGTCSATINQLYQMGLFFSEVNDTAEERKVHLLAHAVYDAVLQRPKYKDVVNECTALIVLFDSYINFQKGYHADALLEMKRLLPAFAGSDTKEWANKKYFRFDYLVQIASFYADLKNADSANLYIREAEEMDMGVLPDNIKLLKIKTQVVADVQNYKAAYENMTAVFSMLDSLHKKQTLEIANNMYALTAAEHSQEELAIAEKEKQHRQRLIIAISCLSVAALLFLWWLIKRNSIAARRKIENINNATLLQIAELKGNDFTTRKKMGMDLHDDVASRLAYIGNMIEAEAIDAGDEDYQQKLRAISSMVADVYKSVREKSHEWYVQAATDDEYSFTESINRIADQALPTSKYKTQIEVDELLIRNVPLPVKIEILRIIQEAITNVLKHAKATLVKIFLYDNDEGNIVLEIKDNGKGFDVLDKHKHGGLGLKAIRDRVGHLKGGIEVKSNANGVELYITIPS